MYQTKISTKTDKDAFLPALFRSRLEKKIPVTESVVGCVCVLFSMAKSMLRMGSCVRFCCHSICDHPRGFREEGERTHTLRYNMLAR